MEFLQMSMYPVMPDRIWITGRYDHEEGWTIGFTKAWNWEDARPVSHHHAGFSSLEAVGLIEDLVGLLFEPERPFLIVGGSAADPATLSGNERLNDQ